jgi:hypothetical protein
MTEKESRTYNLFLDSVADPGCLSQIRIFSIQDPESRIRIKEIKYFNPENCILSYRKYDPGCPLSIPDPDFLPIPDPRVKKAADPDPQHVSRRES